MPFNQYQMAGLAILCSFSILILNYQNFLLCCFHMYYKIYRHGVVHSWKVLWWEENQTSHLQVEIQAFVKLIHK